MLYVSADGLLYPNGAVAMLLLCIPGSEQRFLPLFSPPPPTLVTQLLLSSQFTGDGDTESRDYFGFSDLQKQLLAARGKGGAGAGVRVGGCHWEEAVGIAQDWGGLMGGKRAGKDPAGT